MAPTTPYVVALCGSLRDRSRTRIALAEVLEASREAGATADLVDLQSRELPYLYATESPDGADPLRAAVDDADSVLLGTPNYHGSVSGSLKNTLDYCGRDEFAGTTVGLVEVAGSDYPGSALAHLREISRTLNAWTLPVEVAIPRSTSTIDEDGIADDDLADRARRLGEDLVRYAGVDRFPEAAEAISRPTPD